MGQTDDLSLGGTERRGTGLRCPAIAGLVAALALAAPAQAQEEPTAPTRAEGSASGAELTIRANRDASRLGERVAFSGTRRPARRGVVVQLQYRRAGESFKTVAETRTRADGSYAVSHRPRRNGTFRAV